MFNLKITKMKKQIYFLVSLFALIGFSMNVSAQSTGTAPYPAAKHLYKVDGGGDNPSGTIYTWSILDADAITLNTTAATISQSGTNGTDAAEVYILWGTLLVKDAVYYVKVEKAIGDCKNSRLIKVTIQENTFQLAISTTANVCYTNSVGVGKKTDGEPEYSHGPANVVYHIAPTGLSASQSYKFTITAPAPTSCTVTRQTLPTGVTAGTDTNELTVADGTAAIDITYVITNNTKTDNTDSTNKATVTATAEITSGVSSLGFAGKTDGDKSASATIERISITTIETGAN